MTHAPWSSNVVSTVELDKIPFNGCIDLAKAPLEFLAREALGLGIDGFEFAAIDRDDAGVQEIEAAAKRDKLLTHLAGRRAVVAAEVGDGLEVWCQAASEPDQFQVPPAFPREDCTWLR